MAKASELQMKLRAIMDAMDHSDPSAWSAATVKLMSADDPAGLWAQAPQHPNLARFKEQYLQWKRHLGARTLADGSAFGRAFWTGLADPQRRQAVAGIDFTAAGSPQALLESLDAQPTDVLLTFMTSDHFANTCVVHLMGEMLALFTQRDLTEAEKVNDEGFEHHHANAFGSALPLHDRAIELSPRFALAWINKSIALKNLGRFDEAIACYDHVIQQIDPQYKKAWHNKGVALMHQQEWLKALACFDQAVQLDPEYEVALRCRKQCSEHIQAGKAQEPEATDEIMEEVRKDPQFASLIVAAHDLEQRGMWPQAARVWERLLSQVPSGTRFAAAVMVNLGNCLYEAGQAEQALARFRAAVDSDPRCGDAWMNIARYHLDHGDAEMGLQAAESAIELSPCNSMAWANKAGALARMGRLEDAVEAGLRGVEHDERNVVALLNLGSCLCALGRHEEARQRLEKVIRIAADHPAARLAQQLLDSL